MKPGTLGSRFTRTTAAVSRSGNRRRGKLSAARCATCATHSHPPSPRVVPGIGTRGTFNSSTFPRTAPGRPSRETRSRRLLVGRGVGGGRRKAHAHALVLMNTGRGKNRRDRRRNELLMRSKTARRPLTSSR